MAAPALHGTEDLDSLESDVRHGSTPEGGEELNGVLENKSEGHPKVTMVTCSPDGEKQTSTNDAYPSAVVAMDDRTAASKSPSSGSTDVVAKETEMELQGCCAAAADAPTLALLEDLDLSMATKGKPCCSKRERSTSSCTSSQGCHAKDCEKQVSGVVKGVHAKLRRKLKEAGGDYEKIWNEHCEDEESLGEYAYAMQHLAQEHWSAKHADDRIKWCRDACRDYFFLGGMKKVLEKDRRRKEHHHKRTEEARWLCNGSMNVNGNTNGNSISTSILSTLEDFHHNYYDLSHPGSNRYNTISLPFSGQLRLLDVGSCFNPFLDYDEFLSVGIDISPAVESVHKCDFLNLQLQQPLQVAPDTVNRYLRTLKSPVETLPRECFHVIVFSLLLSYFPSPYQRWICCQKAHQLLQMNGLLLIITPDSSHQNRNAGMIKSWRTAIESLGFTRWRYIKDTHLHYMAFRKTSHDPPSDMSGSEGGPDMLFIPQDFNEDVEESFFSDCLPKTESEMADLTAAFSELPSLCLDDASEFW